MKSLECLTTSKVREKKSTTTLLRVPAVEWIQQTMFSSVMDYKAPSTISLPARYIPACRQASLRLVRGAVRWFCLSVQARIHSTATPAARVLASTMADLIRSPAHFPRIVSSSMNCPRRTAMLDQKGVRLVQDLILHPLHRRRPSGETCSLLAPSTSRQHLHVAPV